MSFMVGRKKLANFINKYMPEGVRIDDAQAQTYKNQYRRSFPRVDAWAKKVMTTVEGYRKPWGHYVRNHFGRVCHEERDRAYKGVNHIIQSWARDLMGASMVRVDEVLGRPLWRQNVHDSVRLDFDAGDKKLQQKVTEVTRCLTDWPEFNVPVRATVERFTTNWAETEDV
jgi:DNA polymerase I-like protein with 3'-5' exonuclease and polymerase domains